MKNLKKVLAVLLIVAVFCSGLIINPDTAHAASKRYAYCLAMGQASTFKVSKGRLTIKASKGAIATANVKNGMYKSATSKKKISYKLAKNCKWQEKTTAPATYKSSYQKMKKTYKAERKRFKKNKSEYMDTSPCWLTVEIKGNKVVKVYYSHS